MGRPPGSDVAEPGARVDQPEAGGSWLVEAEPVGDRGCLPAAGDPQFGQDPGDVEAGGLGRINSAWPICRLVRPSATRASTSASRWVSPKEAAAEGGAFGVAVVSTGSSRWRRPRWAGRTCPVRDEV